MSFGLSAGAIAGLAGGAMSLGGAYMSSKGAKSAAKATVPVPYGVTGPAGGVAIDPKTKQITLTQADNPFSALLEQLGLGSFSNAAAAPNQPMYGANPELREAYQGLFGQGLTDRVQGQYDLLSELAAPGERRDSLALDDQLYSRGMLGTTGGAERFRVLTEQQQQADLQRQVQALGLGRQEALDRFTGAAGTVQQGMAGQLQNFDVGQGSFSAIQQLLQNLFQQAGIGVGAGGGQSPEAAVYAAQQRTAPYQAGVSFLQNSGAFDALGRIIAGGGGGGAAPPLGSSARANFDPSIY